MIFSEERFVLRGRMWAGTVVDLPLPFAEFLENIGKGGLPLSKESWSAYVLRRVDWSYVNPISRREGAGDTDLRTWDSHGGRIDIGRSHDAAGQ